MMRRVIDSVPENAETPVLDGGFAAVPPRGFEVHPPWLYQATFRSSRGMRAAGLAGFRSAPAGTFTQLSPTGHGSACRTRRTCSVYPAGRLHPLRLYLRSSARADRALADRPQRASATPLTRRPLPPAKAGARATGKHTSERQERPQPYPAVPPGEARAQPIGGACLAAPPRAVLVPSDSALSGCRDCRNHSKEERADSVGGRAPQC